MSSGKLLRSTYIKISQADAGNQLIITFPNKSVMGLYNTQTGVVTQVPSNLSDDRKAKIQQAIQNLKREHQELFFATEEDEEMIFKLVSSAPFADIEKMPIEAILDMKPNLPGTIMLYNRNVYYIPVGDHSGVNFQATVKNLTDLLTTVKQRGQMTGPQLETFKGLLLFEDNTPVYNALRDALVDIGGLTWQNQDSYEEVKREYDVEEDTTKKAGGNFKEYLDWKTGYATQLKEKDMKYVKARQEDAYSLFNADHAGLLANDVNVQKLVAWMAQTTKKRLIGYLESEIESQPNVTRQRTNGDTSMINSGSESEGGEVAALNDSVMNDDRRQFANATLDFDNESDLSSIAGSEAQSGTGSIPLDDNDPLAYIPNSEARSATGPRRSGALGRNLGTARITRSITQVPQLRSSPRLAEKRAQAALQQAQNPQTDDS